MSRSSAAVIQVDDPEGAALLYQYQNQPLAYAMKTMHMHYGTAMLRISNGGCLVRHYSEGGGLPYLSPVFSRGEVGWPQDDPGDVLSAGRAKHSSPAAQGGSPRKIAP